MMLLRTSLLALLALPCLLAAQDYTNTIGGNFQTVSESQLPEDFRFGGFVGADFKSPAQAPQVWRKAHWTNKTTDHKTTIVAGLRHRHANGSFTDAFSVESLSLTFNFYKQQPPSDQNEPGVDRTFRIAVYARFLDGDGTGSIAMNNTTLSTSEPLGQWKRLGRYDMMSDAYLAAAGYTVAELLSGVPKNHLRWTFRVRAEFKQINTGGVPHEVKFEVESITPSEVQLPAQEAFMGRLTWID